MDAVISMYLASLGEFNSSDGYVGGYNVKSAWMMFLLATVLLPLLFLNMLIAVMSEPFEEVKENRDALILKKKIEFIVTYIDLIDLQEKFKKDKYIMIVRPEDNEQEEEDNEN
jgi:acyl-coenzyme A synthetase/AMP-(fatty) acid ligase